MDEILAFSTVTKLRNLILAKKISPVELTEGYLRRIDALDSLMNSYLTVMYDDAMNQAKKAEQTVMDKDSVLGPLHGIPISVKDLDAVKGIRTTFGSLVFKDYISKQDSIIIERIKNSGAIILGKTNTSEFGLLGHTENKLGDHCRNPWNLERTSGGSSGGAAAAVSAGLCVLAQGSDGGGSIRNPASFCGVYGLKPTQNRIPLLASSIRQETPNQFSQSGPISRSVEDAAILLEVMSGYDERDPRSMKDPVPDFISGVNNSINHFKLGWCSKFGFSPVDNSVMDVIKNALLSMKSVVRTSDFIEMNIEDTFSEFWQIFTANFYTKYSWLLNENKSDLTWYTIDALEYGAKVSGSEYSSALGKIDVLKHKFSLKFESYDLILTPTMTVEAFPVGCPPTQINDEAINPFYGAFPFTFPINMIGFPAASIPCGFTKTGMPVGLQIIANIGEEGKILAFSRAFEQLNPWIQLKPTQIN